MNARPTIDMVGKKIGRLTVQALAGARRSGEANWSCLCECGATAVVRGSSLRSRKTISCGCFRRERPQHAEARPVAVRWGKFVSPEPNTGCWLWTGLCDRGGYGVIYDSDGRSLLAHRVAWKIHRGHLPAHLLVCHHCDNPTCVNPDHLFLGTNADNTRDASEKGRLAHGPRPGRTYDHDHILVLQRCGARACRICQARATMRCRARRLARLAGNAQ